MWTGLEFYHLVNSQYMAKRTAFAGEKSNMAYMIRNGSDRINGIVGKGNKRAKMALDRSPKFLR